MQSIVNFFTDGGSCDLVRGVPSIERCVRFVRQSVSWRDKSAFLWCNLRLNLGHRAWSCALAYRCTILLRIVLLSSFAAIICTLTTLLQFFVIFISFSCLSTCQTLPVQSCIVLYFSIAWFIAVFGETQSAFFRFGADSRFFG